MRKAKKTGATARAPRGEMPAEVREAARLGFPTGRLSPAAVKRAHADAWPPGAPCRHEQPTPCAACGADLADALARRQHGHGDLWRGTLHFLERHEPQAYRRLLTAWAQCGLVGEAFELDGRPRQLPVPPVGPASILTPSDAILAKYTAFARAARGPRPRPLRPVSPAVLVYECFRRARHHLQRRPALRPALPGETPEDCALALIQARGFPGYDLDSLRTLMRRGRRQSRGGWPDAWLDRIILPRR